MTGNEQAKAAAVQKLGRYEILRELGRGAMGIVYKAHDPRIDRVVVLKTLRKEFIPPADFEEYRARFQREAKAAGILSHPGVVNVYDVGEDEETGEDYMAMEFVDGASLQALLAGGLQLPPAQVAEIVADVADALDYAHRNGVIHRDIKPANLLLGAGNRIKVADFGVARLGGSTLTAEGQALGTPNFMSPEQITGEPLDGRTDLWSLGVVAYQLLTLESPFAARDFNTTVSKILGEMPPLPSARRPNVPGPIAKAVMKALAKRREDRYQTGAEMAKAFREAAGLASRRTSGAHPRPEALDGTRVAPAAAATGTDPAVKAAPATIMSDRSAALAARTQDPHATVSAPVPAAVGSDSTVSAPAGSRPAPPQAKAPSRGLLVGVAVFGALGTITAILLAGWLVARALVGPPPTPTQSLVELMSQGRHDEVIRIAEVRLATNPDDAEAKVYLELARAATTAPVPATRPAPSPVPRPSTLALDLTSSFSGSVVVSVDGAPVIEDDFTTGGKYVFGRLVPGTFRPARSRLDTPVAAGGRHVTVRVESRSGRTVLEEARDLELPADGRLTVYVVAEPGGLSLRTEVDGGGE